MSKIDEAVEAIIKHSEGYGKIAPEFLTKVLTDLVEPSIPEDMEKAIESFIDKLETNVEITEDDWDYKAGYGIATELTALVAPLATQNEYYKGTIDHLHAKIKGLNQIIADLRSRLDRAEKALREIKKEAPQHLDPAFQGKSLEKIYCIAKRALARQGLGDNNG